ncbi:polynucleotide 5'-hydroxyl-kinase NOL9-like isoform X2 [Olea europaea var. sylvestris]|uniref:polynucleotide 5'-hydroxyl-kinase NOL9-like isoform X2 n=1 Tax=Olea europaea var. sylvestris TaxID=158386 RepID=UPI000C1D8758|nr:polynucleotide 5'-hydroxyl-kinase NOL9-like isoform X2 [Olea europaea var. sylvestris]
MKSTTDSHDSAGLPLVINTPGWVKGIGYEILVDMLKYISPTHVVKICISSEIKNLPAGAFWLDEGNTNRVTVIEINSARRDHLKRSLLVQKDSRLLRDLRVMAYFRQCFPSEMDISTIKELARALAAHPPYEISISSVKMKHVHCEVPKTETFYCLNATIIGLAVSSGVSDELPHCVGLGIVRGIDTFKGLLYVITPVPQQTLANVDLLLQGFISIPTCLLQVQGCISPYMSANVLSTN